MIPVVLSFGAGVWLVHRLADLPSWWLLALLTAIALALLRNRRLWPLVAALVGIVWTAGGYLLTEPSTLPVTDFPAEIEVVGEVRSIVTGRGETSRFLFAAEHLGGEAPERGYWLLRLGWRSAPSLHPGDRLRLRVRVKPAHGYASPGAWDYEGWLYRQQVRYTGYVKSGTVLPENAVSCCLLARTRARIAASIERLPVSEFASGVIRALVVGDTAGLSPAHRRLFSETGTSHLMAISGLHIGLVAALGFVVVAGCWRHLGIAGRIPSSIAGGVFALFASAGYASLAGLSTPTQRALIMLVVAALALVMRSRQQPANLLGTAALLVLLVQPSAILSAGFWLSFGAVAAILAVARRGEVVSRWRVAVRIQFAISLALWPLLMSFGLPVVAVAPLINLVLVPVFGLLVVPAALAGVLMLQLSPAVGGAVLGILAGLLDQLHAGLDFTREASAAALLQGHGDAAYLVIALLGVALLLFPRGLPMRWLAVPLLATGCLPQASQVAPNDFRLHVLDVGQGLAAVIETHAHTLVFDTGPAYPSGFSTADAVIVPFLHQIGRRAIDRLVLSHSDTDHAGGARALHDAIAVNSSLSGEPPRVDVAAEPCRAGDSWFWDGVRFTWLHPVDPGEHRDNNASCVLQVSNRGHTVLLTGDIEASVEHQLVERDHAALRSDVVVVPHHGSRTSSTSAFVAATRPAYAVFSSGWANRYGFPAPDVVARWTGQGAATLDTATAGTISFRLDNRDGLAPPSCERIDQRRFWRHAGGLAEACHAVSSGHSRGP